MPSRPNAIKKLALSFLTEHVGQVVTRSQIEDYVRENRKGVSAGDVTRRVRELRQEDGWPISTNEDLASLHPGEYLLVSLDKGVGTKRSVSRKQRARILERDGFTCVKCGLGATDPDPYNSAVGVKLVLDHIVPVNAGGASSDDNLQTLCTACNAGKKAFYNPSKATRNILAEIRSRPVATQRDVYLFLRRKFDGAGQTST